MVGRAVLGSRAVTMRDILLQIAQVLTVLTLAPLVQGLIVQFEERVQRAQGPGIFQPYRDLWKLFHKQIVAPQTASWIYWITPVVAFTCMLTVPILIPVLTNYPLPLSDMGDILGGGLILTLGSFMIMLAGLDTGSAYGGIGSSRAVMVAILAEPTLILVFVGITLLAKAMLPFVVNHLLVADLAVYFSPAHLFLVAAFFILLLVETDRMPIHSSTHIEVYMIEEGANPRIFRPAARPSEMGVDDEAIHPLHDLLQRPGPAVGAVASRRRRRRPRRGRRAAAEIRSRRLRGRRRRDGPVAAALLSLSGAARRLVRARHPGDRRHSAELAAHAHRSISILSRRRCSACSRSPACCCPSSCSARDGCDNYLYAFAAESWVIAALSAVVGFYGGFPELYLVALLTAAVSRPAAALPDLADHSTPRSGS